MDVGLVLAGIFVVTVCSALALSAFANLYGAFGGRKRLRITEPSSKWHRFARVHAEIHDALTLLAAAVLLLWATVAFTLEGLKAFLAWSQELWVPFRAMAVVFFGYILLGLTQRISKLAAEEVDPLVRRAIFRLAFVWRSGRHGKVEEEAAILRYSYAPEEPFYPIIDVQR